MTKPACVRWIALALTLFSLGQVAAAQAARVASYNPSQTTVGYLPSSNLSVAITFENFQLAPALPSYSNRAYWDVQGGTIIAISGTPGATSATVSIPPSLRTAGQHVVVACLVISLGAGQAESCTDPVSSAKFTVNPAPSISTASPLTGGIAGSAYSLTFAATGGTGARTWSVNSGSTLPPGLTLNSSGLLSGTPTTTGTFNFTIRVEDSLGVATTKAFSLTISSAPRVASYSPAATTVGYLISSNLAVSVAMQGMPTSVGGTRAYWNTPSQPLAVSNYTGASATVAIPSNYRQVAGSNVVVVCGTLLVAVIEVCTDPSTSATFSVNPAPSISTASPLTGGIAGSAYSLTFAATGGTGARTWSVNSGSTLPSGLSLNPSGLLSGTPTTAGTFNFTIRVEDSLGVATTKAFSLTINAAPRVASYSPPATSVGYLTSSNLSVSVVMQGMPTSVGSSRAYWNTPSQPLAVSNYTGASATVAIPPSYRQVAGSNVIVVCGTSNPPAIEVCTNPSSSATFTVNPTPSITTSSPLPDGATNSAYSVSLTATGGTGTRTWSIAPGSSLPPGLILNPASGGITGAPTQAGIFNFTVVVTDSLGVTGSRLYALSVSSTLSIVTPATLPTAGLGIAYSVTIQVAGGTTPYNFSTNPNALPPGLVLNAGTGLLTGTPSVVGNYSFPVTVVDAQERTASRTFFITISQSTSTPTIQTASPLPDATINSPYNISFTASGGTAPYQFFLLSGQLPLGLTLNSSTGALSGVPTQTGTFSFVVDVLDSREQVSNKAFTLRVLEGISILTSELPSGTVGVPYPSTSIQVSGGSSPYSFTLGSANLLPSGLFLNPNTGQLTGTPTQSGTFSFEVVVTDSLQRRASRLLSISVGAGLRFRSTSPLPSGRVGEAYNVLLEAEGGTAPYSFELVSGNLPEGMNLSSAGRVLGTPSAPFDGAFTVRVRDAGTPPLSATRQFAIRVTAALAITTESLPAGTVQEPYSVAVGASGGVLPYVFTVSAGSLPPGLLLNSNGTLSGTPTTTGTFPLSLRVTDQGSSSTTRAYSIEIRPRAVTGASVTLVTTNPSPNAQQEVDVALNEARSEPVEGTLLLSFTSSTTPTVDDPAIQFVSGGRQLSFQIPAGQTSARFGDADRSIFQTGTVAGSITIAAQLRVNGVDATPSPAPSSTIVLPALAPTLTNLTVTRNATGLSVVVRGYSTPRNMTSATLNFTARAGSNVTSGLSFQVNLSPAFTTWYGGSASSPFGSQFQLTIPITIAGDSTEITGLSLVLANTVGSSNSLNATF